MAEAAVPQRPAWALLPWIALPFALQVGILVLLWYDAPVMDDYDSILGSAVVLTETRGVVEWLRSLIAFHNEHRAATTRLIPLVAAWITGSVDFRFLMLCGPLFMLGALALTWAEFRDRVPLQLAGAAAFLTFNYSYSEALLHSSGTLPHLGVMFFSFAGLYYALRPGWGAAAACLVFAVLAAFSQANGLVMLPVAVAGCWLAGLRKRAIVFAAVAAAIWVVYFTGYSHPANHPPITTGLRSPLTTFRLYLVIVGGIFPSFILSQLFGALLLALAAWVTWKGLWRRHPTALLWIAFLLASAATVTLGRSGWGIFRADRYAVNAALLMPILLFAAYVLTGPWRVRTQWTVLACAAALSLTLTALSVPKLRDMATKGALLVDLGASGARFGFPRFAGALYPNPAHPIGILERAERLGLYHAPRRDMHPTAVEIASTRPAVERRMGEVHVDSVAGRTVIFQGWAEPPATAPSRKLILYPAAGIQRAEVSRYQVRMDVATQLYRPQTLLSGFVLKVEFDSEEAARRAAGELCVFAEAPGYESALVPRLEGGCV